MFCVFLDVFKEAAIPYTIFISLCVLYIKFICLNKLVSREYGPSWKKDVLILTAHPDDECMFFTPTILNMRNEGHRLYIACLTKGNMNSGTA